MSTTLTLQQLQRGLQLSQMITALEAEMAAVFNGSTPASTLSKSDGRTGKRSAKTIAKMKASQQARWAKVKRKNGKADEKSSAPVAKFVTGGRKKKRTMSPETKAKMAAAMKARWAAAKAGNGPAPTAKK